MALGDENSRKTMQEEMSAFEKKKKKGNAWEVMDLLVGEKHVRCK